MDCPRHQFLARAAFTGDEHIALTGCRVAHHAECLSEFRTVADNVLERIPRLYLSSQNEVLPFKPSFLERAPDGYPYFIRREWFWDVVVDPFLDRVHGRWYGAECGDDDEYIVGVDFPNLFIKLESIHDRHFEIRYNE